jgi:hypothetical protein
MCGVSTAHCVRRPHFAPGPVPEISARECFVSFLRQHTREWAAALSRLPQRWRRQTAGFGVSVRFGYDAPGASDRHRDSVQPREKPRPRRRSPTPLLHSVPVAETSETRERRFSLRSHAARFEWQRIIQTMRPRRDETRFVRHCCHEGTSPPTVLTSFRACNSDLLGQSPDTTAVMLKAAPWPKPAPQDPRPTGPRHLIASSRVRLARFIEHNSVLCPLTR